MRSCAAAAAGQRLEALPNVDDKGTRDRTGWDPNAVGIEHLETAHSVLQDEREQVRGILVGAYTLEGRAVVEGGRGDGGVGLWGRVLDEFKAVHFALELQQGVLWQIEALGDKLNELLADTRHALDITRNSVLEPWNHIVWNERRGSLKTAPLLFGSLFIQWVHGFAGPKIVLLSEICVFVCVLSAETGVPDKVRRLCHGYAFLLGVGWDIECLWGEFEHVLGLLFDAMVDEVQEADAEEGVLELFQKLGFRLGVVREAEVQDGELFKCCHALLYFTFLVYLVFEKKIQVE